jgi:hypothetical protein
VGLLLRRSFYSGLENLELENIMVKAKSKKANEPTKQEIEEHLSRYQRAGRFVQAMQKENPFPSRLQETVGNKTERSRVMGKSDRIYRNIISDGKPIAKKLACIVNAIEQPYQWVELELPTVSAAGLVIASQRCDDLRRLAASAGLSDMLVMQFETRAFVFWNPGCKFHRSHSNPERRLTYPAGVTLPELPI